MHATTISMYQSYLKHRITETTKSDLQYKDLVEKLQQGSLQQKNEENNLDKDEILMYRGIIYVPNSQELKNMILREMHNVPYAGHPGYQKTIAVVKSQYYWPGMKKEVADFIARCLECQKVKAEHRHPASFLQPLPIPEWKWEVVTMDFITKLPRTNKKHDSIMVVVDTLTKVAHFILVKLTHKAVNIDYVYSSRVTRVLQW
jgi:hypothetical protein